MVYKCRDLKTTYKMDHLNVQHLVLQHPEHATAVQNQVVNSE